MLRDWPDKKVLYTTGEKLTATIVESIRNRTIEDIKTLYSRLDLLIIDDIQYIAGKDKTQEIVFTIFNELHNRNKQVVCTSDRPPKAIPAIGRLIWLGECLRRSTCRTLKHGWRFSNQRRSKKQVS